ncbi:MAG: DevR family CRISPR-associated autoregulator [Chloroflexota bacterium]
MKPAYSITCMARATYNLHALNNEESDGNRTLIRNVGIVVPNSDDNRKEYETVNAISGNMFRYIFSSHLANIALDMGLQISKSAVDGHPERIWADKKFQAFLEEDPSIDEVYDKLLTCIATDICGMATLESTIQVTRHSLLHVGWISGLPEITKSDFKQLLRARPPDQSIKPMPFEKSTASGVYAIAVQVEVPRIGYNDKTQTYVPSVDRHGRLKALLLALSYSIVQPLGASIASQLPHVLGIEGLFVVSSLHSKAPLVSPLDANYRIRAEKQRALLSQISDDQDSMMSFHFDTGEQLLESAFEIANNFEPAKYYHDTDS